MTIISGLSTEKTDKSKDPKDPKDPTVCQFSLAAISLLLMDAFNNEVENAISAAKAVEANNQVQQKLLRSLAQHKPLTMPKDAWEWQRKKTHVIIHVRTRMGHMRSKRVTRWKNTLVVANNGHFQQTMTKNVEENKIRQNLQNALSICQQKDQVNLASMNSSTQGSSQTESSMIGILDSFLSITKKIFRNQ